jgi:hypothetical protein
MPNDIIGQVLHTSRKAELNIFDKKNTEKFSKPYLRRLTNNVRVFLNKEKIPMQIEMMSQGICKKKKKKKDLSMEC